MKKCRICKAPFEPVRPLQTACGFECAIAHANRISEKKAREKELEDRRELKRRKEAIKTRADHAREAQAAVNAYVRARDEGLPCISCGRYHQGQWHAGHYLSRGAHPELALEPRNIHRQCQPCNTHLSGNQINFRKGLIARVGLDEVEWLEGPHEARKHSIDDLKQIRSEYRQKLKDLQQGRRAA